MVAGTKPNIWTSKISLLSKTLISTDIPLFVIYNKILYTGGWNLTFNSSEFNYEQNQLPLSISIRENPSNHRFLEVFCKKCYKKLGTINAISGFNDLSVNFSTKYVNLYASRYDRSPINQGTKPKWADILNRMSQSNSH